MSDPDLPPRAKRKIWNYTPQLPIQTAPYWDWPMKPLAALKYLLQSWNPLELRALLLVFAVITVNFLVDLAYAAVDPRLRSRT